MVGFPVSADQYRRIDGKILEIKRQLWQSGGYPFDPCKLEDALQAIIEGRFPPRLAPAPVAFVPVTLPLWRTVRLGVHKTAGAYLKALNAKGVMVDTFARQILAKVAFASEEEDIEIFLGSALDFGFIRSTPRKVIFERAALHGYYPCPAEVGPAGRLHYVDQPKGEKRLVAMEPIANANNNLGVFELSHIDVCMWLHTDNGNPYQEHDPAILWAWCRCKPDANSQD